MTMIDERGARRVAAWKSRLLLLCAVGCLAARPGAAQSVPEYDGWSGLPDPPEVAASLTLMSEAFDAGWGGDYDTGRRNLSEAESLLRRALARDPGSRAAAETLGSVYFYQGYFGDDDGYGKARTFLSRVLEVDPESVGAGRYLAHTYRHTGKHERAREYAQWVQASTADLAVQSEMSDLLGDMDEAFLGAWYEYADFYESEEARVTRFDARTRQVTTELRITPELETQLAAQSLQALTSDYEPYDDPEIQSYLQSLVDRLAARSPQGPPIRNTVEVVRSQQVNATALPGRIFVHTGLLGFVESEAELVAVLSHELAHIYAHHAARQLVGNTRDRGLAGAILSVTGVRDRLGNDLYRQLLDAGVDLTLDLILKGYQRGHEEEADRYGTHIAYNAGYNPTFMTSFFIRLYEANPDSPFKLLATHPPYTERIEGTSDYLEQFPLDQELLLDSRAFQDMKGRLHP